MRSKCVDPVCHPPVKVDSTKEKVNKVQERGRRMADCVDRNKWLAFRNHHNRMVAVGS